MSLAALIKERLGVDVEIRDGRRGQFDVVAGDETIVRRGGNLLTRSFGAGYPDFEDVVEKLGARPGIRSS